MTFPRWLYHWLDLVPSEPPPPWCGRDVVKFAYEPIELLTPYCGVMGRPGPVLVGRKRKAGWWGPSGIWIHWKWIAYTETIWGGLHARYYWDGDVWVGAHGDTMKTEASQWAIDLDRVVQARLFGNR